MFGLGLGLVMTLQFTTVQILIVMIKTGNHGTAAPTFWLMPIVAKWLDRSKSTWYGGRPQRRRHCVR